jgi:hypothetical protein
VLVECGANIGARTDDGRTPLQLSLQQGHHHVARVLEEFERTAARTQQAAAQSQSTAATATTTQAGACAACGASSIPTDAAFKTCARCKAVQYCSKDCQRTHWPAHKASCAAAMEAGEAAERNAAELIEEEEHERAECRLRAEHAAAQKEVHGVPPLSPA